MVRDSRNLEANKQQLARRAQTGERQRISEHTDGVNEEALEELRWSFIQVRHLLHLSRRFLRCFRFRCFLGSNRSDFL